MKKIIVFFIKFIGVALAAAIGSFCGYFVAAEVVAEEDIEFPYGLETIKERAKNVCRSKDEEEEYKDTVVLGFRSSKVD